MNNRINKRPFVFTLRSLVTTGRTIGEQCTLINLNLIYLLYFHLKVKEVVRKM